MEALLKESIFDDEGFATGAMQVVFLYMSAKADRAGVYRLRMKMMKFHLLIHNYSDSEIAEALDSLAKPPEAFREAYVVRVGEWIIIPGWIRQNLPGGPDNTWSSGCRRDFQKHIPEVQRVLLEHHPWLNKPSRKSVKKKKSSGRLAQAREGTEGTEGTVGIVGKGKGSGKGDVSPPTDGTDWAPVVRVLEAYEAASGMQRGAGPGGWIQDPAVRYLVADRLREVNYDVEGTILAIEKKCAALLGGDPKWHKFLVPMRMFHETNFHEAYAARGLDGEKKSGQTWGLDDVA